jgi:hypothetical protein
MMKPPQDQSPSPNVNESLSAEVRELRNRIKLQHRVVELLLERLKAANQEADLSIVEVSDPLPVHPSREVPAPESNEALPFDEDEMPEPELDGVSSIPTGAAWWPTPEDTVEALRPSPGWEFYGTASSATVIGFLLRGMNADETEKAVTLVRSTQRYQPSFIPIFLTDGSDLAAFRKHGYTVEYVPSIVIGDDQSLSESFGRLQMIEKKWNIAQFYELGPTGPELHQLELQIDTAFGTDLKAQREASVLNSSPETKAPLGRKKPRSAKKKRQAEHENE